MTSVGTYDWFMTQAQAPNIAYNNLCRHSHGWSTGEMASLVDLYEGGADFEILASEFSTGVKDIWHCLSWLYFQEVCPATTPVTNKHGTRWELADDNLLIRQYEADIPIAEIAEALGRTVQSVSIRLLGKYWARIPKSTLLALEMNPETYL